MSKQIKIGGIRVSEYLLDDSGTKELDVNTVSSVGVLEESEVPADETQVYAFAADPQFEYVIRFERNNVMGPTINLYKKRK